MVNKGTTTPYYYAGSECSIVSFFLLDDGVRLTISMHVTGESLSVVLPWKEFTELTSEASQICAIHVSEG